jgi:hypothetical protein
MNLQSRHGTDLGRIAQPTRHSGRFQM